MNKLLARILIRILCLPIFIWLFFLIPAGTNAFWQVYVYFGMIIVPMLISTFYFLKHDPELLERRLNTRETESEQKLIMSLFALSIFVMYLIPGFDKRFGWSDIPVPLVLLADGIALIGYLSMLNIFRVNSFASRVIEVDVEQKVIDTGPYARVRHPMYTAALLMYLGTPAALGSWWAYLPISVVPILIGMRILNEESVLKRDLSGYVDYCERVRWRLIPGIW